MPVVEREPSRCSPFDCMTLLRSASGNFQVYNNNHPDHISHDSHTKVPNRNYSPRSNCMLSPAIGMLPNQSIRMKPKYWAIRQLGAATQQLQCQKYKIPNGKIVWALIKFCGSPKYATKPNNGKYFLIINCHKNRFYFHFNSLQMKFSLLSSAKLPSF